MFPLHGFPFFDSLAASPREELSRLIERRHVRAGLVICRSGDDGRGLYLIESGGVAVEIGLERTRIFLGPGQVFGEMSVLTGAPVSATVTTVRDTWLGVLDKERFDALVRRSPDLLIPFVNLLVERLRHRTAESTLRRSAEIIVAVAPSEDLAPPFAASIARVVGRHAPGSLMIVASGERAGEPPCHRWPDELGPRQPDALCRPAVSGIGIWQLPAKWPVPDDLLSMWRIRGAQGCFLILVTGPEGLGRLAARLNIGDAVLLPLDRHAGWSGVNTGLADRAYYRVGVDRSGVGRDEPWHHLLPPFRAIQEAAQPDHPSGITPGEAMLGRWLTRRSIGVAMGAGAALGFAHLGVLKVLDEAGIAIDYVCGSSMGGAVALAYARYGSAAVATSAARAHIGANRLVADPAYLPRSALLRGEKVRRATELMFGNLSFAELSRGCAVVTADLSRRERFVLQTGRVAQAARATVAIPGLFPPVEVDGRLLVDGALVNRIPVSLLESQRCGVRIAVNVIPSPEQRRSRSAQRTDGLRGRLGAVFGLRHVIAESWELLGWWHGAADAQAADLLVEPATEGSGYDFGAVNRMIDAGERAMRAKLEDLRRLLAVLDRPGVP